MDMGPNWANLSPTEKRAQRYRFWLTPEIDFSSPEASKRYKQRVQRLIHAYNVETPDRVPVSLPVANWPAYLAGTDTHTVMYDYDKMKKAWRQFYDKFEILLSGNG